MLAFLVLVVGVVVAIYLADVVFGADKGVSRQPDVYGDQLEKHGPPHQPFDPPGM